MRKESNLNLKQKLISQLSQHRLSISFWGNDFENLWLKNPQGNLFETFIRPITGENREYPEVIVIVGWVNHNQFAKIKNLIEISKTKPLIVFLKGSKQNQLQHFSYMNVDIEEKLELDITYDKYPLDIDEIINLIIEKKISAYE